MILEDSFSDIQTKCWNFLISFTIENPIFGRVSLILKLPWKVKTKVQETFTCSKSTKYYSLTELSLHFSANQSKKRAYKIIETRNSSFCVILSSQFFSISVFFQTLTIKKTAGEGKEPSFIPLYHFNPLTNIQAFILRLCRWDYYH